MNESDLTLWCGNLSNRVTEELLYELFLQAGPLKKIVLPKDAAGYNRSYAFITFKHECSLPYASALFSQTKLYDRPLLIKQSNRSRQEPLFAPAERRPQIEKRHTEERRKMKEPTSWAELNALKGPKEERRYKDVPPNGLGLALEPDFNMLLQMGSQMMFPPSLPMQGMALPPYFAGPIGYPSQMEDMYGSRSRERESHGHGHNRPNHYPNEYDHYREHSNKQSDRRDHGRSNHRNRDSSSTYHHRERRDRRN